ncbi:MAG: hypothetical protein GY838_15390 [bacterium]|nr:hypothetical protein [bacterium]
MADAVKTTDTVRTVEYYSATVEDRPGESRRMLEHLSEKGVNLMAYTCYPIEGGRARLDFFPYGIESLREAAADAGLELTGPRKAFLIQGDDRVGALHQYHLALENAGVNVRSSAGVVDGADGFGYVLWVHPDDQGKAAEALGLS